jgi:hypothetical protein
MARGGRTLGSMFERFTEGARRVVVDARDEARRLGHPHIGTEHLLLGLVDEPDEAGGRALVTLGASADDLRARVAASGRKAAAPQAEPLRFDPDAKVLLERSLREALRLGDRFIDTDHLALALAHQAKSRAVGVLADAGIDRKAIRPCVLRQRAVAPARPLSRPKVIPSSRAVRSIELSPEGRQALAWSARQAAQLGLAFAMRGPLPLRLLGTVGGAALTGGPRPAVSPPAPALVPATCSFCGRASPECGALFRGRSGALICAACASLAARPVDPPSDA